MSVNGSSTIFTFASSLIHLPIGCRHPFIKYWQPLLAKTTATCSLPHPENERQPSFNNVYLRMLGNLNQRDARLPLEARRPGKLLANGIYPAFELFPAQ